MLEFWALMPEINSGLMYTGPGAGPMLAAAAAWDTLASELYSSAAAYGSVIADLTTQWQGSSAASMAAAAAPYVAWMQSTAAQAEQTGLQAKAAVAAYEAAFAMTVPPPVIAANRVQMMVLVATNFFGQNTPAIAATEAQYAEMWAQDAAAMFGYAAASAVSSLLTSFTLPPLTTNLGGMFAQAASVIQSALTGVASHLATIMSSVQGLLSTVPTALQGLSTPISAAGSTSGLTSTSGLGSTSLLSSISQLSTVAYPVAMGLRLGVMPLSVVMSRALSTGAVPGGVSPLAGKGLSAGAGSALRGGFGSGFRAPSPVPSFGVGASLGGSPQVVSGGMGRAVTVGAMSVPEGWHGTKTPVASVLPSTKVSAVAAAEGEAQAPLGLPMAKMAGRGPAGHTPRFELRSSVVPRSPAGG